MGKIREEPLAQPGGLEFGFGYFYKRVLDNFSRFSI
jgi:hypothetical protein